MLNVLEVVNREYKIDPDQTYLIGHSMGGFGTWWLGQKYAATWAAIAPTTPRVFAFLAKQKRAR